MADKADRPDINAAYETYRMNPSAAALEVLLADGKGLVRHYAARYGCGCAPDDLFQTGMLGLLKAAKSYKPDSGSSFSTWASWCIISEIRHFARSEQTYQARQSAREEGNTDGENSGGRRTLSEIFGVEESFRLRVEDKIALEQALRKLGELERRVVDALFYRGMTQQQTARELDLNQRTVSRILHRALAALSKLLDAPNFKLVGNSKSFRKIK